MTKLPAIISLKQPIDRDLIKEIAMDIGKDLVAYIEVMYPKAIEATSSTFNLSIRNHVYNDIMAALDITDANTMQKRLADRKAHRRKWLATVRRSRQQGIEHTEADVDNVMAPWGMIEGSVE